MPLDFQLVQAPFRFGVDEGTDPKQVPFGTLTVAQNVVWQKTGRLQKRQGLTALSTSIVGGGSLSAARRLVVRGDELALITGSALYSYTASGWKLAANQGQLSDVSLEWETLQSGYDGVQASDIGYTSAGLIVHAWLTGTPADSTDPAGKLYYQVIDRTNGARTTAPTAFDSASSPRIIRVLTSGSDWVIVYNDGVNIKCTVNGNAAVTLKTDGRSQGGFDACILGSNFCIAYNLDANGIGLATYSIAAVPVLQTSGTVTGEAGDRIQAIGVDGSSSDLLWIGYFHANGGSSKFRIATATASTLVQSLAPTDVDATAGQSGAQPAVAIKRIDATSCLYAYSTNGQSGTTYVDGVTISRSVSSVGVLGTARTSAALRLISRPFSINGKLHAYVCRFSSGMGCVLASSPTWAAGDSYLVEVEPYSRALPHRLVGHVDVLTAGQWRDGFVSNVVSVSSTEYMAMLPTLASSVTGTLAFGSMFQASLLVTAKSGASATKDMWRSVEVGPEAYLAAGVLTAYDGRMAFDYGWSSDCPFSESFGNSAAGGAIEDGAHVYQVAPEYRSAAGVLHRGPANAQRSVTTAGGNTSTVTIKVTPCHLSQKYDDTGSAFVADPIPPELVLYRATTASANPIPQRLTVEPKYNALLQTLYTSPLTFADTRSDYNLGNVNLWLQDRPAIYTAGGELDDFQPPAFRTVCVYRNRIFGIAGDQKTLWFSKDYSSNPGVAPGFNPQLRIAFDDKLTALAVLDERLFVFSDSSVYYLSGDGPAPNGDGSDYGTPNKLQTEVGCTNPRGVVSGPDGIYFVAGTDADPQIYILDRGLSVYRVGSKVLDLLAAYPNITSAVLVPRKTHVRFSCQSSDGTTGIVLVYDYAEKQWSHFVYGASLPIADACMHGGVYTFVTTAGAVYKESDATNLDAGSWVTSKIETAWWHASGPLAYHSVRNFRIDGEVATPHGLSLSVGFDGSSSYQQGPETFAEGTVGVTVVGSGLHANISVGNRRKCRSIRFKAEDSAPVTVGTGAGGKWSTMGIEVGVKRGLGPLAPRQKG